VRAPARVVHACARGRCAAGRSALQHLVPGPRGYTLVGSRRRAPFRAPGTEQPSALCSQRALSHVRVRHARAGREREPSTRAAAPPPQTRDTVSCARDVCGACGILMYTEIVLFTAPARAECGPRGPAARGWRGRGAGPRRGPAARGKNGGEGDDASARRLSSRRTAGFDKTHAGRQGERDPGENTDGGGAARRPPSLSPPSRTAVNTRSRLCAQSSLSSDRRHSPSPAHAHDHTECN
jgi:hypothetical protein